jgi:hypothetical protein
MMDSWERREEMWDDYFAKDDAIRERYASERLDLIEYEESEREHYEYLQKVKDAGFGDDYEEYEAYWKRIQEPPELWSWDSGNEV